MKQVGVATRGFKKPAKKRKEGQRRVFGGSLFSAADSLWRQVTGVILRTFVGLSPVGSSAFGLVGKKTKKRS